jgi:HAE1 family hydrophobic/amphiphilic exporter-1
LRRRSVTILVIIILLAAGVLTFRNLPVELFPEIEFPLVTVFTLYPSANPEAVARDVTEPIEDAVSGIEGLEDIHSTSSENLSLVLASFKFGTDMAETERTIAGRLRGIQFPAGVKEPRIGRIGPDAFPVLQLSILGNGDIPELTRVVDSQILPAITSVEGVFSATMTGGVERQVVVTVDPDRLSQFGTSLFQVSNALRENIVTVPSGSITEGSRTFPVRTTHTYSLLEELRGLVIGFTGNPEPRRVLLSHVADVNLGAEDATTISRTNGSPSLGIGIIKEPEANTIEVTQAVLDRLTSLQDLYPDIQIVTISNDAPEIQAQMGTLLQEAVFGFLFAIAVVFAFLISLRPTLIRGVLLTLRPTLVIGLTIPLSIFTGVLLMSLQGLNLNMMTLGGLAIAVGRVVDDAIVVMENIYRHIRQGEDRQQAALEATREVAGAITASTLTTIVVFLPLAFIQGVVGAFFVPFALAVTYALLASLLVALTAVPVLAAMFLRPGDVPSTEFTLSEVEGLRSGPAAAATSGSTAERETWIQRAYTPLLRWALRHKVATLLAASVLTLASVALITVIPITLFPKGGERFLSIEVELPPGTSLERTMAEAEQVERVLAQLTAAGFVENYQTTAGTASDLFGPGGPSRVGGSNRASIFVPLSKEAPQEIAATLRAELSSSTRGTTTVEEIGGGPPTSGLEVSVTGSDYNAISAVARQLVIDFSQIDGVINVTSNVAEARDEIVITVKSQEAAPLGLTARDVALQVNQFLKGQVVAQLDLDGTRTDVILRGRPQDANSIDTLKSLTIAGPHGAARLGNIAQVSLEKGPVTISRTNDQRSASITGNITAKDTQAISRKVQEKIDALALPPGVEVETGGIFKDIEEGFRDVFLAIAAGVVLVYLVMVASLGSLRNPFAIIMSLPLALVGALVALAITGRTLGLPAMMGFLLLIGIVVTNAIVLLALVEQLRERGLNLHEALIQGGRVRLRPILMTAFTTCFALLPLAAFVSHEGGIIGAELATVVIGGLISSTFLTLIVVPVVYSIMHGRLPPLSGWVGSKPGRATPQATGNGPGIAT